MITILAQTFTAGAEAAPNLVDSPTPILAILSLAFGLWQRFKALDYRDMRRAAAVGMKAALDALPERKAEEIKRGIKEAVGPLNEAMKAEVRKATAPAVKAYVPPPDDPGSPFPRRPAALLLAASLLIGASGCLSSSVVALADHQRVGIEQLADTSEPSEEWLAAYEGKPGKDGKPWTRERLTAAWRAKWPALLEATAAIRRAAE